MTTSLSVKADRRVADFRGLLNDGRVTASGEVVLKQFLPEKLSLVAELEDVTYRYTDDLPVTASGGF